MSGYHGGHCKVLCTVRQYWCLGIRKPYFPRKDTTVGKINKGGRKAET
jgi:hypothetical protein